jgi:hypothetical protein
MKNRRLMLGLGVDHGKLQMIERRLTALLERPRRGPPFRHRVRFMLFVALMRMRTALPLRVLARLFVIDHVTLWRC